MSVTRWYFSHPFGGAWPALACAAEALGQIRSAALRVAAEQPEPILLAVDAPWVEACLAGGPERVAARDADPVAREQALAGDLHDVALCDGVIVAVHDGALSAGQRRERDHALAVGVPCGVLEVPCWCARGINLAEAWDLAVAMRTRGMAWHRHREEQRAAWAARRPVP